MNGKTFQCDICENQFKCKRDAVEHITMHAGWKPYRCPKCNIAARCESTFRYHRLKCGSKANPRKPLCNEGKEETLNLLRLSKKYDGKTVFQFGKCGKLFKCNRDAVQHIAMHTGWKPFRCSMCNFATRCGS